MRLEYEFESHSVVVECPNSFCACGFLCRLSNGPITHPRSRTKCLKVLIVAELNSELEQTRVLNPQQLKISHGP